MFTKINEVSGLITDVEKRHDIMYLVGVKNSNPNGDPLNNNQPRHNKDTGNGMISKVCVRRKIRDYVNEVKDSGVYVVKDETSYGQKDKLSKDESLHGLKSDEKRNRLCQLILDRYWDIRMFGGTLMGKGDYDCAAVRGAMQMDDMTSYRSISDIIEMIQITCIQRTKSDEKSEYSQFGDYYKIPYALYYGHAFFNPFIAKKNGVTSEDLQNFYEGLQLSWELDKSSARGLCYFHSAYIFTHESPVGNYFVNRLFDSISVSYENDGLDESDYNITYPSIEEIPEGIALTIMRS